MDAITTSCLVAKSYPTLCNPMDWLAFPGKNTGVCCHLLLPRILLTQGFNLHLLHWQPLGKPQPTLAYYFILILELYPLCHLQRSLKFKAAWIVLSTCCLCILSYIYWSVQSLITNISGKSREPHNLEHLKSSLSGIFRTVITDSSEIPLYPHQWGECPRCPP